jgi:hypothetical protein
LLDWLDDEIALQCPDCTVIATLKIGQSGVDDGPLSQYGAPSGCAPGEPEMINATELMR